jgi:hypothetical protein
MSQEREEKEVHDRALITIIESWWYVWALSICQGYGLHSAHTVFRMEYRVQYSVHMYVT